MRDRLPADLGGGLRLRWGEPGDLDRIAELNDRVWQRPSFTAQLRDLYSGAHPRVSWREYTVVDEPASGRLVSFMGLVSQTWRFGSVHFRVGMPETVVTDPAYRRRGLIRAQFDIIHALSEARGEPVQAIWGIPWYYRQYGYEYGIDAHWGHQRDVRSSQIPAAVGAPAYRLRPLVEADRPYARALAEAAENRDAVAVVRDDRDWSFVWSGCSAASTACRLWRIIETASGRRVGFVNCKRFEWAPRLTILQMELSDEAGCGTVLPALLEPLWRIAEREGGAPPEALRFALGREHPCYAALPSGSVLEADPVSALYVRVADLVGLLRSFGPALERNLAASPCRGWSGTLQVSSYRTGFEMEMEEGRILGIEPWRPEDFWHQPSFPELTFIQLLFGRRRCAQLAVCYPDCRVDQASALLLDGLFPPMTGNLWLAQL